MKKTSPQNIDNLPSITDYGRDRKTPGRMRQIRRKRHQARQRLMILALIMVVAAVLVFFYCSRHNGTPLTTTAHSSEASGTGSVTSDLSSGTSADVSGSQTSGQTTNQTSGTSATSGSSATSSVTLSAAERQARLDEAAVQVTALLESNPQGRFAVYFQNLSGGEIWAYQAEEPFVAASSIKLGINTFLYTRIASGEINPDEVLAYDSRAYPTGDYEGGTGTIQGMPNGTELTVRETSGLSIRVSDNCGTNMVIRRLGGIDAINPWLNQISGKVDYRVKVSYTNYGGMAENGRHRTCALDLGLQAVRLYQLWQENMPVYEPLMDDLSKTEFDFGIQKGIPGDIRVAHKIGTNGIYSAENDVGLVFTPEPFAICVMTEMASAAKAHEIQADVAAIFYGYAAALP